jgi:Predicted membrane protein
MVTEKLATQHEISMFEGSIFTYIGFMVLFWLGGVLTLGLAIPWIEAAFCSWVANNTVIEGKRLDFDGTGSQLFGNYIKWLLLTIITLGIYSFWLFNKMMQWRIKHTFFKSNF